MEDFATINLNSPSSPVPNVAPNNVAPNREAPISTDPRLSSQPNEIFSFRGETPNLLHQFPNSNNLGMNPHSPPSRPRNNVNMVQLIEEEQKTLDEEEYDEDLEEVSFLLLKMVKSNLVFQIFFVFFFVHFLWQLDFRIILGLAWLNDAINCFICIHRIWSLKKKRTCCLLSKNQLKLFDNFVLIIFKVIFLFFLIDQRFPVLYGLILLLIQNISQAFYMMYVKFYRKKPILSDTIEFGFRFFVLIQTLMVALNLQGLLQWQWKDVFWCFWVIFSILTGATLGFALIFLGKMYQKCFETVENFELKGLFWLFSTTAGITINSALTVTEICEFIDEKGKNYDDMMNTFIGITTYFGTMLIYCILFRKDLIKFLEKIGSDEDENYEIDQEQRFVHTMDLKKVEVKKLKTEKNPSKYFFPAFLKKTSSTYFKAVNSSILLTVSSQLRRSQKSSSKNNSFANSKPRLNSSKDDKSPLSGVHGKKADFSQISEHGPRAKSHNAIISPISDPGLPKNLNLSNASRSPKFKSPISTDENKFQRKNSANSGSNQDQSINCCLICFENAPDSVFMDCGHGGMCYTCATDIFKKTGECYLCRKIIKQVLLLDLKHKDGHYYKVKASTRMVNANEDNNSKESEK